MGNYLNINQKQYSFQEINSRKINSFKRRFKNDTIITIDDNEYKSHNIISKTSIKFIEIIDNKLMDSTTIKINHLEIRKYAASNYKNDNFDIICNNSEEIKEMIGDLFNLLEDFIGKEFKKYYYEIYFPYKTLDDSYTLSIFMGLFCNFYNISTDRITNIHAFGKIEKNGIVTLPINENILTQIYANKIIKYYTHLLCPINYKKYIIDNHLDNSNTIYLNDYIDLIDFLLKYLKLYNQLY